MFPEVVVGSKCSPLGSKTGPTEKFLQNKRSTRISGSQLKIKNQIMAYRWLFAEKILKN